MVFSRGDFVSLLELKPGFESGWTRWRIASVPGASYHINQWLGNSYDGATRDGFLTYPLET